MEEKEYSSSVVSQSEREEALSATRALMEMKHLGSTLRLAVYVPGPQVPGLTEPRAV